MNGGDWLTLAILALVLIAACEWRGVCRAISGCEDLFGKHDQASGRDPAGEQHG